MKKSKLMQITIMIVMTAMLAACGNKLDAESNGSGPSASNGDASEQSIAKALDRGVVVERNDGSLLITSYQEQDEVASIDAYSLATTDETQWLDASGASLTEERFPVGSQVEVWTTGPVRESYPAQADAAKLILLDDQSGSSELIGRTQAVRTALEAQTEIDDVWSVKEAKLDEANQRWRVELVANGYLDNPVSVAIDAATGEITQDTLAENEAFRVFAPKPDTVMNASFTVEGEAKVFEAAFNWSLEDGHTILAEGHETADGGAPAWGAFSFQVSFDKASQENMTLILYTTSAKDGSAEHQLIIPLKVAEDHIAYMTDSQEVSYDNSQYGFQFSLPDSWKGYTIVEDKWEGNIVNDDFETIDTGTGPLLSIRHPEWTKDVPRQDIPIMILTREQWDMVKDDKLYIGAAPIIPSELGRNSDYVFALPARYNFAFPEGFEEVEDIMKGNPLHAYDPKAQGQ
ncbi:Gmad2 immunoglobulin-like domain-containing protein [Paenibacillus sp. HB172176]|uniref:Gmad2 immunoglobulin-like domain-containing protein n=1 Tax=Paenibacillus sp. HB172176 TaxID=2493690 RepID=UPI00143AA803|nr:Gmad2 immunoglobulin-like domain-containing protein [Paenibacillus sp. HB172176]